VSGDAALVDRYDLMIFDLDGVVYLGPEPVRGAVPAINRLLSERRQLVYATNNAARRPDEVAGQLTGLGIPAVGDQVLTSPQVAAALLAEKVPAGSAVLVVGTDALAAEVAAVGLVPVTSAQDGPDAVVQGYGPQVGWPQLAEACVAIRAGALWVATNADRTLPSPRGPLPGNGALVAALATALDRQPDAVVGKPAPALFERAACRAGATRPLVVGDRLDTDIEGAVRAGMASLLVLTGASTPADVLVAPPHQRPTHLADDLSALFTAERGSADWEVRRSAGALVLDGAGPPVAALRALAAAAWADGGPAAVVAGSPAARAALDTLNLTDWSPTG
jgi:HAD superfamily hydrolase (TIGR01450 family)